MPIRPLPPLLINQIAAGEVIERPASVVKELVENAIDAGARRIEVAIENGGRDLIEVTDDGRGIEADELELAVAPHATSKISESADLNAIATLGFRGEALASIASVSRLTLVSRTPQSEGATELHIEGDQRDGPRPGSGPVGTTLRVRNLFFNTPARRKFLRTDQTESSRVVDVVETIAMSHPDVGFRLSVDGKQRLELPPVSEHRQRVLAVVGAELAEELLVVEDARGGIRISGLAGTPTLARRNSRAMRVFLNGRPINDRTVNHAIREAYRGLIAPDRYPTAVVSVQIDPASVDVNVHPAKAEVRFRRPGDVHSAVRTAVFAALQRADLTPQLELSGATMGGANSEPVPMGSGLSAKTGSPPPPATAGGGGAGAAIEYFRELDPKLQGIVYSEVKSALAETAPEVLERQFGRGETEPALISPPKSVETLVVQNCYIVTEVDEGLMIIDQHALHERVMFEVLLERITSGATLESQRMLMPLMVPVAGDGLERLASLQPILERLGIEARPEGVDAIAVDSFTSLLFERRVDPITFLTELLSRADQLATRTDPEAALHEVLDMMACKAAVKAGDSLSPKELQQLMESRERVERSSRCPHGRPTSLLLTRADLDRQFGRS